MAYTIGAWEPEEDEILLRLMSQDDIGIDEVSQELNRTTGACRSRHYRLTHDRLVKPVPQSIKENEDRPTHDELFRYLRDARKTLRVICDKYDRSPVAIRSKLFEMEKSGYIVVESKGVITIPTNFRQEAVIPDIKIADMEGHSFNIGIWSELHSGSQHSQPSSLSKFIHYAHKHYDIKHFASVGDFTDGMYVYRGHEKQLIPTARPLSRQEAHLATERQVKLADTYIPKIGGVRHYMLGGNHDWSHVRSTGKDPLRMLCDRRQDLTYMGYDIARLPLTDAVYMRLWHPLGGGSYAKSYKLQRKGIEPQSMEALREAIRLEEPPISSIIVSGHHHFAIFIPSAPIYGIEAGAFQAQTDFLKRLGLFPDIGGTILGLKFGDNGMISQLSYTWVGFDEVKDDWKNWSVPEIEELDLGPDPLDNLFEIKAGPTKEVGDITKKGGDVQ